MMELPTPLHEFSAWGEGTTPNAPPITKITLRLGKAVALRSVLILRNHGSPRAAAEWPENGSKGNLGLKRSLRGRDREPEAEDEEATGDMENVE